MVKTWKERLYDISCNRFVEKYIPTLPLGLALLSIVCCFVFGMLFDLMLLSTIFYYMFLFLPIIGFALETLFNAVKNYNKETFCHNKIMNSLLANESFVLYALAWTLIIICVLATYSIFNEDAYILPAHIATFLVVFISYVIRKPVSRHFKRKIIYIENENSNVKDK